MTHENVGVRTFDLSTARENERVTIRAAHLSVLKAEDTATLRLGDPNGAAIPLRQLESLTVPDDIERVYLSNPSGSGDLVLLVGVKDVNSSPGSPSITGTVDVNDRAARQIGKARLMDKQQTLVNPRTDAFVHEYGSGVDVNASTETVEFVAPDRAESVTVHADDWDGSGHVSVSFLDSDGGTVLTERNDDDTGTYGTGGTDDVFVDASIASPYVRVEIVDDSGASNTVDYTIYAR